MRLDLNRECCLWCCRQVDFDQLQDNLAQMERRCKASWDYLKVIAKHEMKPALKQKMSDFLKDCAERIIILKIVHRRIINRYVYIMGLMKHFSHISVKWSNVYPSICRFHAFLLFLGHPIYAVREVSIHRFSKILSEFALEYRTTRERVLQQKQKRANHRERNKTRGKMITDVSALHQRLTGHTCTSFPAVSWSSSLFNLHSLSSVKENDQSLDTGYIFNLVKAPNVAVPDGRGIHS